MVHSPESPSNRPESIAYLDPGHVTLLGRLSDHYQSNARYLVDIYDTPFADCGGDGARFRTAFPVQL
jgi:hypothetical protein